MLSEIIVDDLNSWLSILSFLILMLILSDDWPPLILFLLGFDLLLIVTVLSKNVWFIFYLNGLILYSGNKVALLFAPQLISKLFLDIVGKVYNYYYSND